MSWNSTIETKEIKLSNHLPDIGISNIRTEILEGLQAKQKYISPKFFYDQIGSELFEEITQLEEYYPTRTEKGILASLVPKLDLDFKDSHIVELGSGDPSKISLLLQQIPKETLETIHYIPVDISHSAIENSIRELSKNYSLKDIQGIVLDFISQLDLLPKTGRRVFCFLGSTIGNLSPEERRKFISHLSHEMKAGDEFLLGIDMVKNSLTLEKAYNDRLGVTAKFNRNILNAVNELIQSDFNPSDFAHDAFYNKEKSRIEMHLKALKKMEVSLGSASDKIVIEKGETIHTENSYKFSNSDIIGMADSNNVKLVNAFSDEKDWFRIIHFRKNTAASNSFNPSST